jgi:hypothetical protein
VVKLHDQRTAALFEVVDHVELPERAVLVEGLHGDHGRHVEDVAQGPLAGTADAPEVVSEVDVPDQRTLGS